MRERASSFVFLFAAASIFFGAKATSTPTAIPTARPTPTPIATPRAAPTATAYKVCRVELIESSGPKENTVERVETVTIMQSGPS